MRILVVEDDKKIGSFIVKGLTQAGFSVDLALMVNSRDLGAYAGSFYARAESR